MLEDEEQLKPMASTSVMAESFSNATTENLNVTAANNNDESTWNGFVFGSEEVTTENSNPTVASNHESTSTKRVVFGSEEVTTEKSNPTEDSNHESTSTKRVVFGSEATTEKSNPTGLAFLKRIRSHLVEMQVPRLLALWD